MHGNDPCKIDLMQGPTTPPGAAMVTVCHGPYAEQLPLAGNTIARILGKYGVHFEIDEECLVLLDGLPASRHTTVSEGQTVTFVRPAGEKG